MGHSNLTVILSSVFSFLVVSSTLAQDRPIFLQEDLETQIYEKCYCKPGVKNKSKSRGLNITFTNVFNSVMEAEDDSDEDLILSEFSKKRVDIKVRFPIINKESLKLIGGLFFKPEFYAFKSIGNDQPDLFSYLNKKAQKSTGFEATLLRSWNEKHYSLLRFKASFNGTYSGFVDLDNDQAIYSISALYGFKKNENIEWGIGVNYNNSFRTTSLLPFLIYNRTFNNRWGIETVLPAMITLRRNVSDESIVLLSARYGSRSAHLDLNNLDNSEAIYDLNHSEMKVALTLEKLAHSWIWVDLTAGIQFNFSTDFESKLEDIPSFQIDPRTSPFVKMGIFLSLPDKEASFPK